MSDVSDIPTTWKRTKWFAMAAVLALYLMSVCTYWYPTSDSALYLMLRENILGGEGYTLWGKPHVFVPPGYPLLLAAMLWVGSGSQWWLNFVQILLALLTLWVCYRVLLKQTSAELALLVTLVVAFSKVMLLAGVMLLSDLPFMLLVWVGIWCYLRGLRRGGWWLEAGMLALVGSCWIRVVGVPLVLGAAVGLLLQPRRIGAIRVRLHAVLLVAATILTATLFTTYHQTASPDGQLPSYGCYITQIESRSLWASAVEPVKNWFLTSANLAHIVNGQRHTALGPAIALFWIPTLAGGWVSWRRRERLTVCIVVSYLGALLVYGPLLSRYLLPMAPLLVMYFCEGLRWLVERRSVWRPHGRRVVLGCAVVLLAIHFPKAWYFSYSLHWSEHARLCKEHKSPLWETAGFLRQHAEPGDLFLCTTHHSKLAYLSDVPSMLLLTDLRPVGFPSYKPEDFDRWVAEGLSFVVVDRVALRSFPQLQEVMNTASLRQKDFRPVFHSGSFEIYRLGQ